MMSTPCINEVRPYMSYKWNTPDQLSNLYPYTTLNDQKMAPTVEQEKNTENGDLVAEHPDEHYASNGSSSSENNSDVQPDIEEDSTKLRHLSLNASSPNVNGSLSLSQYQSLEYAQSFLGNGQKISSPPNGLHKSADATATGSGKLLFDGLYRCMKCDFVGRNDDELHEHALRHDPFECGSCGFMASTQSNLKRHLKEDHPEITPDSWDDNILYHGSISPPKKKSKLKSFAENVDKPRKTACNLCHNFVGNSKMEYYSHLRTMHEASGKLLPCNLCPFIALYKHHLEYHFRNHYGSKPYKCDRCDYSCVNRSMLNSHYKSHSDIYQYSCKNCSYMTKYLHSLKMHLRKYNHEPGRTLNPDGSINSHTIIDVHGKRRGPKSKKRKSEADPLQESTKSPKSSSPPSPPSTSNHLPSQNIRILYNPQIYNNYTGNLYVRPEPSEAPNYKMQSPPNIAEYSYKCAYCEFVSGSYEIYHYHMFSHINPNQTSASNFNPNFPFYLPQNMDSLFATHYGTEFRKNNVNQSIDDERRKIGESARSVDATKNDIYSQNSPYTLNCDSKGSNHVDKKESSLYETALPPTPFDGHQFPKITSSKSKDIRIKSSTPPPKATFTVKEEIPETMNEIPKSFNDNAPLDLSVKQPSSPDPKSNGFTSPYSQSPGATMDRAILSVSPKSEDESKLTIRKANRRKGRAFKLNQYTVEIDPVSDGIENESMAMQRSEIKKSVPRINFKPTVNTAKWNGHNSHQAPNSEFQFKNGMSDLIPNKFDQACTEPDDVNVPLSKTARDIPSDSWCPSCSIDQGSAYLLQVHSSFHSKKDPFTCAKCGLRCHNKIRFLHHLMSGSRINGRCINSIEYES